MRTRVYASPAERQAAYRERKRNATGANVTLAPTRLHWQGASCITEATC